MQEKLYQIRTGTGGICYKRITAANVTVIPAYIEMQIRHIKTVNYSE